MNFRKGNKNDIESLKELGINSWMQFKDDLTDENWSTLYLSLNNDDTYTDLLSKSECVICETDSKQIIGMAFLVPKGNPTEVYDETWCHLRYVSVDPEYRGKRIGQKLTELCI